MLESRRCFTTEQARPDLQYIGGTEHFEMWVKTNVDSILEDVNAYPLRIERLSGDESSGSSKNIKPNWDIFKLPLRKNHELYGHMHPEDRCLTGYWKDVELDFEDVQIIEAYLRCFAPWVLGEQTNEE